MKDTSVKCQLCPKTWPRDPVLEVACPKCGAAPGRKCKTVRPSQHSLSSGFVGLAPWGHTERDLAADAAGAYGECPQGKCSNHPEFASAK